MQQTQRIRQLVQRVLVLSFVLTLSGCSRQEAEPIKIGFLGGLTGRYASLGVDGRDGTLLAIELANAAGGINGQRLELLIHDDQQTPETAQLAVLDLHRQKVAAVIGPFTSSIGIDISPLINQYKLVTVGPTISTNELCNRDDYFLRVYPASANTARKLAALMSSRGLSRVSVIYDQNNRAHCESWYQALQESFEQQGGKIVLIEAFNSSERGSFYQRAESLLKTPTDGIVILANSVDTGLISQQLNKLGYDKSLFASEWSFTNDLLLMGGAALEGMTIFHTFNLAGTSPRFLQFVADYTQRFGRKPGFAAAHAFDATNFVLTGLKTNPDPERLKETLLTIEKFAGLQSDFHLDRYGDVQRELFLTTVRDGSFTLIE